MGRVAHTKLLLPGSCRLRVREREGAWLEGQRVVAENRVTGGAGAAGIPIGGRKGSKGQAEVKVLFRDSQQDLVQSFHQLLKSRPLRWDCVPALPH